MTKKRDRSIRSPETLTRASVSGLDGTAGAPSKRNRKAATKALTILFVMRNAMYLRPYESVIRRLCEEGHVLHITVDADRRKIPKEVDDLAERLAAGHAGLSYGTTIERSDHWWTLARIIRPLRNYLRYLHPRYKGADRLRGRAQSRLVTPLKHLVKYGVFRSPRLAGALSGVVALIERAIPADRTMVRQLQTGQSDLLLVTPLVDLVTNQVDWIKAARAAGVPSGFCVASWDNLTNKGVMHVAPDRVMVWNEIQKQEAIDLHGIAPQAVSVTGAQVFDHWFEREPSRDYPTFCRDMGLDPAKPTILYCGSSIFITRYEPDFVLRWLAALRTSDDEQVSAANVLIRPHPMHRVPFERLDVSEFDGVAVHPRRGGMPVNENARADYFDALYHCSAVVAINTSAMVEAAILEKRCFTVRDSNHSKSQDGTLHYHYLAEGGLVKEAETFEAHIADLSRELSETPEGKEEIRAFVGSFVRPLGLDRPGTPELGTAITQLAGVKPSRSRVADLAVLPLRLCIAPLSLLLHLLARGRKWLSVQLPKLLRWGLGPISRWSGADLIDLVSTPMPLDYRPERITILATSSNEFLNRTRSVTKKTWTAPWIETCFRPGEVFFDIGANIGVFALLCARVHDRRVKVYAFEPAFSTFNALCRNIMHNGCSGTITPVPFALSERSEQSVFKYRSVKAGAIMHAIGEQALRFKDTKEIEPEFEQAIFTMSLDDMIESYAVEVPNHIKIDVDGSELAVLAGARKTLSDPQLRTVMVTLGDDADQARITEILNAVGMKLVVEFGKPNKFGSFEALFSRTPEETLSMLESALRKSSRR